MLDIGNVRKAGSVWFGLGGSFDVELFADTLGAGCINSSSCF